MAVDDYIPVDSATLATRYPAVYAVGDCATAGFRRRAHSPRAPPEPLPHS
jgi:pyruvate/2-oxoglutarate dehydrogenase complex dihydrolipoamide dehydrogenase (E3) component